MTSDRDPPLGSSDKSNILQKVEGLLSWTSHYVE
jgi:hypothetical protein